MPTKIIFLFFILLSILFISVTLLFTAKPIYLEKVEKIRISNIQKIYHKSYFRKRNQHIPQRSIKFAQEKINQILIDINFDNNNSRKNYQSLAKIIDILDNLKDKAILEIKTYNRTKGSKQLNLKLSQKRADQLKNYIKSRSKIIFISAIGYGEELQHKKNEKKYIKLNLKRIK